MNEDLTCLLDPETGTGLLPQDECLVPSSGGSGHRYPVVRGIPRFVEADNYAADFGTQWKLFPKTQLDSHTGLDLSESRLARCLRGHLGSLKGRTVLEAGSGAGRFTEVLLKHGATVHSFDLSNAVEANADNNGRHAALVLVQADIRRTPFPKASYDYVVCLGVLQHTPCPEQSIRCLWEMVKPGGALAIDHYRWKWSRILPPPIGGARRVYRQLLLRQPEAARWERVRGLTDFWFPVHWRLKDSRLAQRVLKLVSPVTFYYPQLGLRDRQMHYEWALLDTHDSTTDYYRHYRTTREIRNLLESLGGVEVAAEAAGNGVEAFCRKPA